MNRTEPALAIVLAVALLPVAVTAGNLDDPGTVGSNMPTTTQIYDRLNSGADISAPTPSTLAEPAAGPTAGAQRTLAEIQALLPAKDNTSGAAAADVLTGRTFWGLRTDGTWGLTTGTAAAGSNVTGSNGSLTITIPNGLYSGGKTATAADTNLVSDNIRPGATIFGITGKRWKDLGNGTIQDMKTDLVWQQADDGVVRKYDDAVAYCAGLSLDSGVWRLPELAELRYISDGIEPVFSFSPQLFIGIKTDSAYLTSTASASYPGNSWWVDFSTPFRFVGDNGNMSVSSYYVRCVRGGQ